MKEKIKDPRSMNMTESKSNWKEEQINQTLEGRKEIFVCVISTNQTSYTNFFLHKPSYSCNTRTKDKIHDADSEVSKDRRENRENIYSLRFKI
jgi:hypothetical protein